MDNFGYFHGQFWIFSWAILDIFMGNFGYFYAHIHIPRESFGIFGGTILVQQQEPNMDILSIRSYPMYVFLKPSHCPDQPRCVRVSQSGPSWAPLGAPFHSLTHLLDIFMEKIWTSRYLREPQYGYENPKLSHIVPLPLIHLSISLHLGLSQPISAWVHCCLDALNKFCKLTIKNLSKLS